MSITAMITDKAPEPGSTMFHFGGKGSRSAGRETIVRVWPNDGEPWFGVFPSGRDRRPDATGLHVWPSKRKLFVVASGSGFMVDINNPDSWNPSPLSPITDFHSEGIDGLFAISDNLRVAAFAEGRLLWKSAQISWNGVRNLQVAEASITGEAWDDLWGAWVSFIIDVETGKHQGGATFSFDHS